MINSAWPVKDVGKNHFCLPLSIIAFDIFIAFPPFSHIPSLSLLFVQPTIFPYTSKCALGLLWSILTFFFNIHGSVHRNNILIQKSQQDAHVTEFILSDDCSTCFGYHYHPSSGAQNNCNYSIWWPLQRVGGVWSTRHPHTQISSNFSTIATDNNTV